MSRILEKQLTDYLVTDQARFYRLAYSYLKDREEALDAVQTAVCRALEKQRELKEPEALRQEQEALEGQVQRLAQRKQEQKAHRRNVRMGKGHKKK